MWWRRGVGWQDCKRRNGGGCEEGVKMMPWSTDIMTSKDPCPCWETLLSIELLIT
jgi:hypothetical protein